MSLLDKLVALANKLDANGFYAAADAVDEMAKKVPEATEDKKPTRHIALNDFAKRQIKDSPYSYFAGTWDELLNLVETNFSKAKPGYRDGVVLVPVPPDKFYSGTLQMSEGHEFHGKYAPRRPGERPYMQLSPKGQVNKMPAKSVDIVLYRHDVLLEGKENSTDAEWEIISINASPWEGKEGEVEPMHPETLMRNYFKESGGTEMKGVTPEQFVAMLKKSRDYWHDKTTIG